MIKIDGGFGEGGGQVVRSAITISSIINKPVRIENIRKNRKVTGLRPQHLTAIRILQKVCNADVKGAEIGSSELEFFPKKIKNTSLTEDVGTAGSISLILQVLVPVFAICNAKLNLTIKGGTDGKWSPTINYTSHILKEAYSRMGIEFSIDVIKRGYYPKGGGIVNAIVYPSKKVIPLLLSKRSTNAVDLICSYSKLSKNNILDKINNITESLHNNGFSVQSKINQDDALDKGATILAYTIDSRSIIGIDSLFDFQTHDFTENISEKIIQNDFGVDDNLADMIVVPASMADGLSKIRLKNISKHLETNLFVVSKMTGCKYGIGKIRGGYELRIEGISNSSI